MKEPLLTPAEYARLVDSVKVATRQAQGLPVADLEAIARRLDGDAGADTVGWDFRAPITDEELRVLIDELRAHREGRPA